MRIYLCKEVGSVPLSVLPPKDHFRLSNFFSQPEVRPEGECRVSFSRDMRDGLSTLARLCVCSSAVVVGEKSGKKGMPCTRVQVQRGKRK